MSDRSIAGGLSDFDTKLDNVLKYKNLKVTSVVEVTYEIASDYDNFQREVKEYYKTDGRFIGRIDPLDSFSDITSTI